MSVSTPFHHQQLRKLIRRHFNTLLSFSENGRRLLILRKERRKMINKWGDRTPKLAAVLESIPTLRSLFYSVSRMHFAHVSYSSFLSYVSSCSFFWFLLNHAIMNYELIKWELVFLATFAYLSNFRNVRNRKN
jgi:hypothetical protein